MYPIPADIEALIRSAEFISCKSQRDALNVSLYLNSELQFREDFEALAQGFSPFPDDVTNQIIAAGPQARLLPVCPCDDSESLTCDIKIYGQTLVNVIACTCREDLVKSVPTPSPHLDAYVNHALRQRLFEVRN